MVYHLLKIAPFAAYLHFPNNFITCDPFRVVEPSLLHATDMSSLRDEGYGLNIFILWVAAFKLISKCLLILQLVPCILEAYYKCHPSGMKSKLLGLFQNSIHQMTPGLF